MPHRAGGVPGAPWPLWTVAPRRVRRCPALALSSGRCCLLQLARVSERHRGRNRRGRGARPPLLTFRPSVTIANIAASPHKPELADRPLLTFCAFRKEWPASGRGEDVQVEPLLHIKVEGALGADVAPNERRQGPQVGRHHARHSRPVRPTRAAASARVIGIETRLRLFGSKSRGRGVDAALVPHHAGFRGLQIAHTSQSAVDPLASRPQSTETRRNTGQAASR
jgi:hypothetical protein